MTSFPSAIASLTRPAAGNSFNDASSTDGTVIVDALSDEIEAIEGALGTNNRLVANVGASCTASYFGYVAHNIPPSAVTTGSASNALTTGTQYVYRMVAETDATSAARNVDVWIGTVSTTLTLAKACILDSTGAKLGSDSASVHATWNASTGKSTLAIGGTFALTAGSTYYVVLLAVGTTGPKLARSVNTIGHNGRQTGANLIWSTNGTGKSVLDASLTLASNTAQAEAHWVALY